MWCLLCKPKVKRETKPSLESLMRKRKWRLVENMLLQEDGNNLMCMLPSGRSGTEDLAQNQGQARDDGQNILHIACRFKVPLTIAKLICKKYPRAASSKTKPQRYYPLHLAVTFGAHPEVIAHIAEQYPKAAGCVDCTGKTPLHLLCQNYPNYYSHIDLNKGEAQLPLHEAMLLVVRLLTRAFPKLVNVDDEDDVTALEYAIDNDCHITVVRSIQRACERHERSEGMNRKSSSVVTDATEALSLPNRKSSSVVTDATEALSLPNRKSSSVVTDATEALSLPNDAAEALSSSSPNDATEALSLSLLKEDEQCEDDQRGGNISTILSLPNDEKEEKEKGYELEDSQNGDNASAHPTPEEPINEVNTHE